MRVRNSWAAYQINTTVAWFGTAVENALAEQVNRGDAKRPKWQDKYTLEQILTPNFRLPPSTMAVGAVSSGTWEDGVATVIAMATEPRGLVKQYRYVGPEPGVAS